MTTGTGEFILLMDDKGLPNTEYLDKSDPYIVVKYGGQERIILDESAGAGKEPKWNETLTFKAEYHESGHDHLHKLTFRIMDRDYLSSDDFFRSLRKMRLLAMGFDNGIADMHPQQYRLVLADKSYRGITFTAKASNMSYLCNQQSELTLVGFWLLEGGSLLVLSLYQVNNIIDKSARNV